MRVVAGERSLLDVFATRPVWFPALHRRPYARGAEVYVTVGSCLLAAGRFCPKRD